MNLTKTKRAIRKVAKRHGMTEQDVVMEIEIAIREALDGASRGNDHAALCRWNEIPCAGDVPNGYELVDYLSGKLVNNS